MSARIGRFFSPSAALVALGIFVAGLLVGGYAIYLVVDEARISIGGFVLAGALVLGAAGALTRAFPRGCNACRKPLAGVGASFPVELYATVEHALANGDARALYGLATAPQPASQQRVTLVAELCPSCARVGVGYVAAERWTGDYWHADRTSTTVELSEERAHALHALVKQRSGR